MKLLVYEKDNCCKLRLVSESQSARHLLYGKKGFKIRRATSEEINNYNSKS